MKDTGSKSSDSEQKKYKETPTAGQTFKTEYLKKVDGKAAKDTAKVKRSMIKE